VFVHYASSYLKCLEFSVICYSQLLKLMCLLVICRKR